MRRFWFRFAFVYFVLFIVPFPIDYLSDTVAGWVIAAWDGIVTAAATYIFHVSVDIKPAGSGDTTWNWVQFAVMLAMALVGAAIWMIFDRKDHPRLREALRTYVRFYLAATMFGYGAAKVIPSQFPMPGLDKLVHTFGQTSPMGLLWTFMGASPAYNFFTGAMEILGGLLLTVRRTTLLGALVSAGVLSNIVALNFFYDVPVKLYSAHLLTMALYIAAPDFRRLIDFFVLRRPVTPPPDEPLIRGRRATIIAVTVRTLFVAAMLAFSFNLAHTTYKQRVGASSPLRGIWFVEDLQVDGKPRPPLLTDRTRWRRIVIDNPKFGSVQLMNDERRRFLLTLRPKTVMLASRDNPAQTTELAYERRGPDTLVLDGMMEGRQFHAVCRREKEKEFVLLSRGFHWINEFPYNR